MKTKFNFTLLLLIAFCQINSLKAQSDVSGFTGHAGTNTAWYVGWDITTTFPLRVEHEGPYAIEFYTDRGANPTLPPRMIIDGATGNVGMGTTPVTGVLDLKLSVDNDINLNSSAWMHGYWINRKLILSTPGIRNTLVGENAGNTNSGS